MNASLFEQKKKNASLNPFLFVFYSVDERLYFCGIEMIEIVENSTDFCFSIVWIYFKEGNKEKSTTNRIAKIEF